MERISERFVFVDANVDVDDNANADVVGGATDVVVFNNRRDILPLSLPLFSTLIVYLALLCLT